MSLFRLQILNPLPPLFSFLWQRNINYSPSPGIPPSQKTLWVGCYDTSSFQTGYYSCKRTQKLFSPAYSEKKIIKETNARGFNREPSVLCYNKNHPIPWDRNRYTCIEKSVGKYIKIPSVVWNSLTITKHSLTFAKLLSLDRKSVV